MCVGGTPDNMITMKARNDRPNRCCHSGYGYSGGKGNNIDVAALKSPFAPVTTNVGRMAK